MAVLHRPSLALACLVLLSIPLQARAQGFVYSEETQRAAYAYCAEAMNKPLHLHKLKIRNGRFFVLGSDGSGVTVSEAQGLNRCAKETLRRERNPES